MTARTVISIVKSECAKLGSQKLREVSAEMKRKNIEKYNAHLIMRVRLAPSLFAPVV